MNLTDSRLAQAGNEKLELAMLSFFEQFRKIYIGDQVQKSSKVTCLPCGMRAFLLSVWPCRPLATDPLPMPATVQNRARPLEGHCAEAPRLARRVPELCGQSKANQGLQQ